MKDSIFRYIDFLAKLFKFLNKISSQRSMHKNETTRAFLYNV